MADHGAGRGSGSRQPRRPLGATVKDDGSTVIAASQRPDGSWRKEVRVREGYAPRDELAPYRPPSQREPAQPRYPVGWDPSLAAPNKGGRRRQQQQSKPSKPSKPKPKAPPSAVSVESVTATVGGMRVSEAKLEGEALARRVKALHKKLRQMEELEGKVGSGGGGLTVEQREKLGRKAAVEAELRELQSK